MNEKELKLPEWFTDMFQQFKAGISHTFIIHGNITDLVPNPDAAEEPEKQYITLKEFFKKVFEEGQMVIFYQIASGIRFLRPEMETTFKKIAGLEEEKVDSTDPIARAKADLAKKRGIPREPEACLPLIEKILKKVEKAAVIVSYTHQIAPAVNVGVASIAQTDRVNTVRLCSWAQNEDVRKKGNMILLLTDQAANISSQLRQSGSCIQTIFVPKPSKEERKAFLQSMTKDYADYVPKDFNADIFAIHTQGMGYRQILEIFLRSIGENRQIDLNFVKKKKTEISKAEHEKIMLVKEVLKGFEDIGDLEYIKDVFKVILEALKKGEVRLVPMGIILMGPPGTCKTKICEALAAEAEFNCVEIKNLRSMWVGESEANFEKLTNALRDLAPVIVIVDEADQAESKRGEFSGDSGVSNRLRRGWMEFLSDPKIRGKVLVIKCTNRPDLMDVAEKRSGRSDLRIPMLLPGEKARPLIFQIMFKRWDITTSIKDFTKFNKDTEGKSGADIETIVLNAFTIAAKRDKKEVDEETLIEAIDDFIPSASQNDIDLMTILAITECSSRSLLPPDVDKIIERIKARGLVPIDANLETILNSNNVG